jgi:hypothetical protein
MIASIIPLRVAIMKLHFVSLCWVLAACGLIRAEEYPQHVLKVEGFKANVYLPDAEKGFYRGSRFDWAGVVGNIEFAGHTLFTPWLTGKHDPKFNAAIVGPVDEFGNKKTPGFTEAKIGENFLKIGIGELRKHEDKEYNSLIDYKVVKPASWKIATEGNTIHFNQQVKTDFGYGYTYDKTLTVASGKGSTPQKPIVLMTITYRLANTGEKPIETNVFNHNFYNVDRDTVGENYRLRFPFDVTPKEPKERFEEVIAIKGPELTFRKSLERGSIYSELIGYTSTTSAGFSIHHSKSHVRMKVIGTAPISLFNLWGVGTTICPEPFHDFSIKPGEKREWSWTYQFDIED